jgi:CheY-like chemotaxis protein
VELVQVNADYDEVPAAPLGSSDDDKIAARAQRTVLVVDDDQAIREALSDVLGELGYDVAVAGDGQQALDCLRQGCNPYVILLDLGMPVMDGWQFRRELLQDPRFAGLNVVVITAVRDQRVDALQVTDVLTKPVQLERLLEILETKGESS